jgi:hypothetical protein
MPPIPFAEWRPDMPAMSQWAREALNVIPAEESYVPFPALATNTNALAARAQGAAWFRCPDGTQKTFAGDATKLYLLSSATWSDVSRTVGGAYGTGGSDNWRFEQFGTLAVVTMRVLLRRFLPGSVDHRGDVAHDLGEVEVLGRVDTGDARLDHRLGVGGRDDAADHDRHVTDARFA